MQTEIGNVLIVRAGKVSTATAEGDKKSGLPKQQNIAFPTTGF